MSFKIDGTAKYIDLGTGFWGIITDDGQEIRPINMPEQLKIEGKRVQLTIKEVEEGFSLFMWGTPVELVTFHT